MREKMLLSFFMITALFFFVSCGEETDSDSLSISSNGTELNREELRKARFKPAPTILKKSPLRKMNTQTWGPVSTGQTQCFDHEKQIECPASRQNRFFFQDRSRIGTRSLTATDSQTITDDVTHRIWSRHIKENVTWYEAKYYCESLRMAGKRWRLPTTAELRSIVNYGQIDPATDAIFYQGIDKTSLSKQFWASDHSRLNSETSDGDEKQYAAAWIINFFDGFVEYTSRYNVYNVRCVTEAD
ncbi:DUF1566 domain-containing protein [bacterium]|nr:DUF1566 domain-containing protein [bacterium]